MPGVVEVLLQQRPAGDQAGQEVPEQVLLDLLRLGDVDEEDLDRRARPREVEDRARTLDDERCVLLRLEAEHVEERLARLDLALGELQLVLQAGEVVEAVLDVVARVRVVHREQIVRMNAPGALERAGVVADAGGKAVGRSTAEGAGVDDLAFTAVAVPAQQVQQDLLLGDDHPAGQEDVRRYLGRTQRFGGGGDLGHRRLEVVGKDRQS